MRSCYCRCTVCANREGRCTWLWRGDRIMMSSGNIAACFLNPQILFPSPPRDGKQHRPLLWRHSNPIILCFKTFALWVLEAAVDSNQNAPHVHRPRCHLMPLQEPSSRRAWLFRIKVACSPSASPKRVASQLVEQANRLKPRTLDLGWETKVQSGNIISKPPTKIPLLFKFSSHAGEMVGKWDRSKRPKLHVLHMFSRAPDVL